MIGKMKRLPELFIPGDIGDFVPGDHILKRVDAVLDLSWLESEVAHLYCTDNGRASIPPESALRLMLAGLYAGIKKDRALMREAQVNLAIRWFAGYSLTDSLPDHSSLTRIRQRWGEATFRRIFTRIVAQCMEHGLVSADTLHIDATLIRADVSWESLTDQWVDATLADNPDNPEPPPSRTGHKKKRSATDPDATMTTSSKGQSMEPSYKQHTVVDDTCGVIVDVEITTGEASEGEMLLHTIDRAQDVLGEPIRRVTADAAYAHSANYAALEQRRIDAVIPPQKPSNSKNPMPARRFKFDAKHQCVVCPRGKKLTARSRVKNGWIYRGSAAVCGHCPLRARCIPQSAKVRAILITDGHQALLRARRRHARGDRDFAFWYKRHRWRAEGAHGEAKEQHALRRAARRGLANVAIQAYLTAMVINAKRLATFLHCLLMAQKAYSVVLIASPAIFRPHAELVFISNYLPHHDRNTFKSAA